MVRPLHALAAAIAACLVLTLMPEGALALTDARLAGDSSSYGTLSPSRVEVSASSELTDEYGAYPASNAADGNLRTTWAEAASGNGEGEWLSLSFPTQQILGFVIRAGYQKSQDVYKKNARPRRILIGVDGEAPVPLTLDDVRGPQLVLFDEPVTTGSLTVELSTVYKGSKYKDTCITDIGVIPADNGEPEDDSWRSRFRIYLRRHFRSDPYASVDWLKLIDLDMDGTPEMIVCPYASHVAECLVLSASDIDSPAQMYISFDTDPGDLFHLYRDQERGEAFWLFYDLYIMQGTRSESHSIIDYAPGRLTLTEQFGTYDAFEDQAQDYGRKEFRFQGEQLSEADYARAYARYFEGLEPVDFQYASVTRRVEDISDALQLFDRLCEDYEASA